MNQLIMIFLISLLVLVHEAGHFIAARLCGVKVTRFGFGMPFGPSWKMFSWKGTDFYLHAFIFGGYVSFPDDEPESSELNDACNTTVTSEESGTEEHKDHFTTACESSINTEVDNSETLPFDSCELFENKTKLQKLFIVSAGVIMNALFAVFLVILCASIFHKLPTSSQNIYVDNFTKETTSNIQTKGVEKGDKFLKANGIDINNLYQLTFFASSSKLFDDYAQKDLIEKNLIELKKLNPQISETIKKDTQIIIPAQMPENPLKVSKDTLLGLEKYKKDGIKLSKEQIALRDEIYQEEKGTKKRFDIFIPKEDILLNDLACALSDTYKPLSLTFLKNGKEITVNDIYVGEKGLLGVILGIEDVYTTTHTPKEIITKSCSYLYTTTTTMLYSLWQLISGKVSASDMHGVIAIVKVGGDIIASKGILNGILLTAMISINLAIMNLLPIPALDGGHIMFLIVESITGKKPSKELAEKITGFFFILLIILMISICYNDIFALVTKKF